MKALQGRDYPCGVNCQRIVDSLGTLTGRAGFAWDRSLIYVKAGGAWTNSSYAIFGNTVGNSFGNGNTFDIILNQAQTAHQRIVRHFLKRVSNFFEML
jgi:hypothetical protein